MNKKLLEMLNAVNKQRDNVRELFDAGKIDEAREAKNKLKDMQADFEKEINKDANSDILDDLDDTVLTPAGVQQQKALNANDETKAFLNGVRHGFSNVSYMKEGSDEDGGYTVPQDIVTKINHYRESIFSFDSLVSHESVNTKAGSRVYQVADEIDGYFDMDEDSEVEQIENMKLEQVKYNIHNYGGFMPITNNLLADSGSDVNLEKEIVQRFARFSMATRNKKILEQLRAGKTASGQSDPTYKVVNKLKDLGTIINVDLGSTYKDTSVIITNDNGIDMMDQWTDANGRGLLQPVPGDPKKRQLCFGSTIIPVKTVSNKYLKNITVKGKTYAPIIVGDLKEAIRIFERQGLAMDSSKYASVGNFNAFSRNLTLFRGIERFDTVLVDKNSYQMAYFGTALDAATEAA